MPLSYLQRHEVGRIRARHSMERTEIAAYQALSESAVRARPTSSSSGVLMVGRRLARRAVRRAISHWPLTIAVLAFATVYYVAWFVRLFMEIVG